MAQSRLERIGTIYTRTRSLLRGGAMKVEDQPLWYAVYEAFPPKVEPRFDREVPKTPIREIFYKEDTVRAKFQKEHKKFLSSSLRNNKTLSNTQRFLSIYEEMEKSGMPQEESYSKALEAYMAEAESFKLMRKEEAESFETEKPNARRMDKQDKPSSIDLKNIFAE